MSLARYALSEKVGRSDLVCSLYPAFVPFSANLETKARKKKQKQERHSFIIPRLFPFTRVCSLFSQFGNKSKKKETKARKPPTRYALSEKAGRRATRDFALSSVYVILFKLSFVMLFSTMIDVENSPSGLWRTLGKRVGVTASRVRISYSPRLGF